MMNTAPSTNVPTAAVPSAPLAGTSGSTGLPVPAEKDKDTQWYFTAEELANSPSRRQGIDSDTEISYRQLTAYLIQEMGQRLKVSQLCINTAIVYMHRFYAFHSFTHFHRNGIASASLFLAAKVEEQPRKLEHVIKAANKCLNQPVSNNVDAQYLEAAQDLVFNENVLLQTLGFDVAIDHPHTHVVKTCHLVKACKDLTKTSYFLASNSLHLTSMCLQYRPTVVACFCIYLACKWSRWEIPQSTEGKHWFHYVDRNVTMELLKQLTDEFIAIYEKSPARLKSKLNSIKALAQGASNNRAVLGKDGKRPPSEEWKMSDMLKMYHSSITISENSNQSGGSSEHQQQLHQSPHTLSMPPILPPPQQQQNQQQQQHLQPQQQPVQQQMRKSDIHNSQHRQQSSSSSSHHSKHAFPSVGDMTDHKSSYKNQQASQQSNFNGNNQSAAAGGGGSYSSSSRLRDHSQISQQSTALPPPPPNVGASSQAQRSNMPLPSSSRTSVTTSSGHQAQSSNLRQQVSASGMTIDSHQNYQKVRERSASMHTMPNMLHNVLPPHKLSSKGGGDANSGRSMLAPKESKHKLYGSTSSIPAVNAPTANTTTGMREFTNSSQNISGSNLNMPPTASTSSKMDTTSSTSHELSRGMLQHNHQRAAAYTNNSNNNNLALNNPVIGNLGYSVQQQQQPPPPTSQQHRQSNAGNSNSSNTSAAALGIKLEHSGKAAMSSNSSAVVHMHTQLNKQNFAPPETVYTNAPVHELQSQSQQQQPQLYPPQQTSSAHASFASIMRGGSGFDSVLGEDQLNSLYSSNILPMAGQQQQTHGQMKSTTSSSSSSSASMYATTESGQQHMMGMSSNNFLPTGNNNNNNQTDTNGSSSHRTLAHIKPELSPRSGLSSREKERDRIKVSPSSKREKHRQPLPSSASAFASSMDPNAVGGGSGGGGGIQQHKSFQQQQQQQQQYIYKKPEAAAASSTASIGSEQHTSQAAIKRPMLATQIKHDEDGMRETKLHKQLDPSLLSLHVDSKQHSQIVNGIETNPDLVRNLLKESLCTTSALIKPEPMLIAPDLKPPAELFATPFDNQQQQHNPISSQQLLTTSSNAGEAPKSLAGMSLQVSLPSGSSTSTSTTTTASTSILADESAESKDREKHKKNKKEKHKHKEKEKSKDRDREERKKHKKDKDRHKEKERESDRDRDQRNNNERSAESVEPFKIKIRKDIIESSTTLNPPPFKIKIPKERISGDLNFGAIGSLAGGNIAAGTGTNVSATITSNALAAVAAATNTLTDQKPPINPTLKIKISKDKIEGYTGGAYQQHSLTATSVAATTSYSSAFDQAIAQQNPNFYSNYFTPHQQQQQTSGGGVGGGSSAAAAASSHSISHHSSSSSGGGGGGGGGGGSGSSSKKKDRDRDRSRDREREKKRHCSDSNRSLAGALGAASSGSSSNVGTLSNIGASSSHGHSSHPPRTHSSNRH